MKNGQVQCPNCKSYKTTSQTVYLISSGFAVAGCLGGIFLIVFFPLVVIILPVGLLLIVIAILDRIYRGIRGKPVKYKCGTCGVWFEK